MKKTLLFLGTIAVSAVTSGVTVWAVDRSHTEKIEYIEREVERTPALGSHFTAYEADKYPDLTYAAENAVKAVVNIEAIQQVDVSSGYGGGAYDPFFEFFGIPQGYGRRGGQPRGRVLHIKKPLLKGVQLLQRAGFGQKQAVLHPGMGRNCDPVLLQPRSQLLRCGFQGIHHDAGGWLAVVFSQELGGLLLTK